MEVDGDGWEGSSKRARLIITAGVSGLTTQATSTGCSCYPEVRMCACAGVPSQVPETPRRAKAVIKLILFRTSTCAPRVYLTFLFFQDWSISSSQRNTSPGNPRYNSDDSVRASNPCSLLGQKHVTPPAKASPRRHTSRLISLAMRKPCHNCRRSRLRCDLSVPACRKCFLSGQQCLGYGKMYTWNNGVASRGKMMGKSFEVPAYGSDQIQSLSSQPTHPSHLSRPPPTSQSSNPASDMVESVEAAGSFQLGPSLLDPLVQDLSYSPRYYLSHCKSISTLPLRLCCTCIDGCQSVAGFVKT